MSVHGFSSISASAAAPREVGASYSRRISGARSRSVCMTPARTADADAPVIRTKNTMTGMPIMAARRRLPPQSRTITPSKMETCIPETATV